MLTIKKTTPTDGKNKKDDFYLIARIKKDDPSMMASIKKDDPCGT
jgi:hypothetical protein